MRRAITIAQSDGGQLVLLVDVLSIIPRQFIITAPSTTTIWKCPTAVLTA
jgi:hypothetical protein